MSDAEKSRILILQVDGKLPNLALMRIAAHHRELGADIIFRRADSMGRCAPQFDDPSTVYASAIFTKSFPLCQQIKYQFPSAMIGGTGWSTTKTVASCGINLDGPLDYAIYPNFPHSIGFTQRGCRLRCGFCVVPEKEGGIRNTSTIRQIWRGDPWPKNILLLDNDFFGGTEWRERLAEIRDGGFKVCFSQGINARFLTDETAEAIASVRYSDDNFKRRMIYTAWDNAKDEQRLFDGLNRLIKYGVRADNITVYMLIGYWPGETHEQREYRRKKLQDFGARPFPMPYQQTHELLGYARWVIRRDALNMSWAEFSKANYRPEKVTRELPIFPLLEGVPSV